MKLLFSIEAFSWIFGFLRWFCWVNREQVIEKRECEIKERKKSKAKKMDILKKMFGLNGNEKDAQNNNKIQGWVCRNVACLLHYTSHCWPAITLHSCSAYRIECICLCTHWFWKIDKFIFIRFHSGLLWLLRIKTSIFSILRFNLNLITNRNFFFIQNGTIYFYAM